MVEPVAVRCLVGVVISRDVVIGWGGRLGRGGVVTRRILVCSEEQIKPIAHKFYLGYIYSLYLSIS